jgi:hypothetical protein
MKSAIRFGCGGKKSKVLLRVTFGCGGQKKQGFCFSNSNLKPARLPIDFAPLRHSMPASDLLVAVGLTCPPYAPDLLPPSGREWVALGVVAFVPDPALAEREFVLRID